MTAESLTPAAIERECARELEARRSTYQRQVEGGRMTPGDRDRKLAIASAWLQDARRLGSPLADRPHGQHTISWSQRRGELRDELDQRARHYPEWIEGGRLLKADAEARNRAMESLLARYEDGWDFTGPAGERPRFWTFPDTRTPAERQAAIDWLQIQLDVAVRTNDEPRRANALAWLELDGIAPEPTVQQELAIA